jgi:ABC-2 type transport system permease protein
MRPAFDPTVVSLVLHRLVTGRRALALALLPLLVGGIALAYFLSGERDDPTPPEIYASLAEQFLLPSAVAFVAVVLGASALGDERDDGTILYLAATPLRRITLVASSALAAWIATTIISLPGLAATFVFALGGEATAGAALWSLLGLVATTLCYSALFGWLSLAIRRPVLIGFLYIVLWEGSVAAFAPSARWLSVSAYGRALVHKGLPAGTDAPTVPAAGAVTALLVLVAVTAVLVLLAARRFPRVELP